MSDEPTDIGLSVVAAADGRGARDRVSGRAAACKGKQGQERGRSDPGRCALPFAGRADSDMR